MWQNFGPVEIKNKFVDNKSVLAGFVHNKLENTVRKEDKADYQYFLFYVLKSFLLSRLLKPEICSKGIINLLFYQTTKSQTGLNWKHW